MERDTLVSYLNNYLRIKDIKDKCENGLTVEGPNEVTKVAFAVDSCLAAFEQAIHTEARRTPRGLRVSRQGVEPPGRRGRQGNP